jgi:hypothetical protein
MQRKQKRPGNIVDRISDVLIFVILMLAVTCVYSAETPMSDNREDSHVAVYPNGIRPAIGCFLLIRRDDQLCAIKFTGAWRGNDAKTPTSFNSGAESFRAEYDWYYLPGSARKWTFSELQSGHSQVERKPLVGLGRFAFQTGKDEVECGPMRFLWIPPTQLMFRGRGQEAGDQGYEMAPTKWVSIQEINPEMPYLKWYRHNEKRQSQLIPVDDLW